MTGILNIYKEAGMTSHDVVAVVRGILHTKKVGHTGTLDPQAEGVLPICVGRATKVSSFLSDGGKTYLAELVLGVETDTEDLTGTVLKTSPPETDRAKVERAIMSFVGKYSQIPPMYSAIKVNGKKLYELARAGDIVEREPRDVIIYSIEITENRGDRIMIEVSCSKGTYIRTLCADIGKALGCGACMGALTRLRLERFDVSDSITLERLKDMAENGEVSDALIRIEDALAFDTAVVSQEADKFLQNGNKIKMDYVYFPDGVLKTDKFFVYGSDCRLSGIYEETGDGFIKPVVMLR